MMLNKLSIVLSVVFVIIASMVAFSAQSTMASDPKWREKQAALFEQIGLKPGDIIEKEDWKKVDGLLPSSVMSFFKRGYIRELKIAEFKYDVGFDDEWINAGLKNAGKYTLDEKKVLVEAATGKPPLWVYGIPFPNINIKNDPDGAVKFMYNNELSLYRGGASSKFFTLEWVGENGLEREIFLKKLQYNYWGRSGGQVPNPQKHRYRDIHIIIRPYDVLGTSIMAWRKIDGTPDDTYAYVPAIRRVKRTSGANRSDPFVGSDMSADDDSGWYGQNTSMKWRFIEEKVGLYNILDWCAEHPHKMEQGPNGEWIAPSDVIGMKPGFEDKSKGWAHWAVLNAVWVPRIFYVIEATPLDPYYNYGKQIYWFDKETYAPPYKDIYNKAGENWKTFILYHRCFIWGKNKGVQAHAAGGTMYDSRTNRATVPRIIGKGLGCTVFDAPDITPETFTVGNLSGMGK